MNGDEKQKTGLLHSADSLRKLLIERPDLPIVVFAGSDCNSGDYDYMSCGIVRASIGEFLDCQQTINDERCYMNRSDFRDDVENHYWDFDGSDDEFETLINNELAEYDPYWKPCIIVYVNN